MDKASCRLFYYNYHQRRPEVMTQPLAQRAYSLGVVILAAGSSARMGRPKLLLPWGRTSMLGHLIRQWRALGAKQIAVVCSAGIAGIQEELSRLRFPGSNRILNPAPEKGMFSSIKCAARWPGWRKGITHWAIVLGDQPHLQPQTLQRVLDFSAARPARICQPARSGHGRHPVLLPRKVLRQLAASTARTLKTFLAARANQVARCALEDTGLDLDIDRPADYRRAVQCAQPQARRKQPKEQSP
jgi:molybdenum cofactor cytidylyltransferase